MLDKRSKNILYVFGFVLLVILITEITRPTPINWRPSYTAKDKIPFGSFVLFEELKAAFGTTPIEKVKEDPYVFLSEKSEEKNTAYLFINDYLDFDKRQIGEMLNFVELGNTVLISANYFGAGIEDTLGFYGELIFNQTTPTVTTEVHPALFSPSFERDTSIVYKKGIRKTVFTDIDTLHTKALGYYRSEEPPLENLNFIEVAHGEGKFLIHTLPEAFSNYYMLQDQQAYAAHILSYVDAEKVYWDTYLKSGKRIITSPMRYVFNQKPLRWAYYVLMIGLILFVIFRAKREQRIIEVVKPLQNTSIEFTRTIGQMYFQHKDFGNIIAKKINYFLEIVRSRYFLDTNNLDAAFTEKLALKSGNNIDKTNKLIRRINHQKSKAFHNEADLLEINKLIEDFRL